MVEYINKNGKKITGWIDCNDTNVSINYFD